MRISARRVAGFLTTAADTSLTTTERGRALEQLAVYLLETIPGVSARAADFVDAFKCEEIDVALRNTQRAKGLTQFDGIILVECKNWSRKVGSSEVAWFDTKLRVRDLKYGILIALNGITGDSHEQTSAHNILQRSVGDGRRILVLTKDDLTALSDSDQLVAKLEACELELILDFALPSP